MNKFIFLFLSIFLIIGCSYEPILTSKEYEFKFSKISYDGEDKINEIIKSKLLQNNNNAGKGYEIKYKTIKNKEILSSNSKGDPTVIKMIITLDYSIIEDGKDIFTDKIQKQATYNNINDKFELSQYEENVINNLANNISSEILMSVNTLSK